jgi:hypothetical protein
MAIQPDNPEFQFRTMEEADAFRKTIWDSGLRFGRPIVWHDNNQRFPKDVTGASCFFLRLKSGYVGVTAAHVVRQFQTAKATTPSLVCQLHLMPFDLEGALIDINDDVDIATFAISERDLKTTLSDAFDVSSQWPPQDVVQRDASIQLVGYPENIRIIDPTDRSAVFQAWGALDFVEDFTTDNIFLVYQPDKVTGAPNKPPLAFNMSGCSGGPAIIHETRNGLHRWYPVGLIVGGPKVGEGEAAEFDIIPIRRIDCIGPDGRIQRPADTGWLPP